MALLGWSVHQESKPNPGLLEQAALHKEISLIDREALPPLPIDQRSEGNLEGKELRFGPGAAPTFVTATTAIQCGSVNCMHDSLNPLTGLTPLSGMWLNCVFGGKGVGLINMLVYLILAVFLSGLMVGRTPEYLGKKVEAREMKLAMLALLIHPSSSLARPERSRRAELGQEGSSPTPPRTASRRSSMSSARARPTTARASRAWTTPMGSTTKDPGLQLVPWDIITGIVMLLGRFVPIIAPIALAGSLAAKS